MHLIMFLSILALAWGLRCTWTETSVAPWTCRWHRTLELFLLPPLLLFTSAIAVIWMGPHGQMVWVWEGWLSYLLAIGLLGFAAIHSIELVGDSQKILHQIRTYPISNLHDHRVRILDSIAPYSAQIGWWEPELVVTQGLLDTLGTEHLEAVLVHEQAHYYYRDTFYFSWLGLVRRITGWLPQTEAIWQELLVLRELRADRWASKQTDPLLIAEALLFVVQSTSTFTEPCCVAFNNITPPNRLTQRIEALLTTTTAEVEHLDRSVNWWFWLCLLMTLLPLLIVPFHS
jgi:Zn-dependent protease with chaperone function